MEQLVKRWRSWGLWSNPRALVCFVLTTDVVVALSVVTMLFLTVPEEKDFARIGVLLGLNIAFEEIATRIAALRVRLAAYSHVDMTSVWTFAGAMVLPPALAAVLCVLILGYAWLRHDQHTGMRAYRQVFGASAVIVSCFAARLVLLAISGRHPLGSHAVLAVVGLSVSLAVYLVVNGCVIYMAIYLAVRPVRIRQLLEDWQVALEMATLCLGALTAFALLREPVLVLLVVPPMFVLQRSVLTNELEIAATTDAKTGLLNAATWHHVAQRELARASREHNSAAVLIIDMDNFKRVNDDHGHLVGDDVLKSVADCLAAEMRPYDSIGRFGGEEFVAVLSDVDELSALNISERIRQRIAKMEVSSRTEGAPPLRGLTASIGVACYPEHGTAVEDLLHTADAALYAAKRGGRNRVEISSL